MTSQSSPDYYEVLGLNSNCTAQEIKRNYHQLALIWHPDKHHNKKEAELKFGLINEAYTVLSDYERRSLYDLQKQQNLENLFGQGRASSMKNNCYAAFSQDNISLLKDILIDRQDTKTFEKYNFENLPNNFEATLKSYLNENVISSEDEYIFSEYQPVFMDGDFSLQFKMLSNFYQNECDSSPIIAEIIETSNTETEAAPKPRRKSSLIIIQNADKTYISPELCAKLSPELLSRSKEFRKKFKNTLKRPFLYNEEEDLREQIPQKKVKRPQIISNSRYSRRSFEEDKQQDFNLKTILKGISIHHEPITVNLSLKELRQRLQKQI